MSKADPLLQLIFRPTALTKLKACLADYNVHGLPTNVDFLMRLADHDQVYLYNILTTINFFDILQIAEKKENLGSVSIVCQVSLSSQSIIVDCPLLTLP